MPTLSIPAFGGEVPHTEPRALQPHQSSRAVNCDLARGSLRPLRGALHVDAASGETIFKHDTDGWLTWPNRVNAIKSAVVDVIGDTPLGHLLITGERNYPTQRFAGGQTYRLGIPRPDAVPAVRVKAGAGIGPVSVYGFGAEDGGDMPTKDSRDGLSPVVGQGIGVAPFTLSALEGIPQTDDEDDISRSSAYCYTYVQSLLGGVYQQESAPSPPSEILDVRTGDGVIVSGFSRSSLPGLSVTHIRIYRTVSGNSSADFHFVAEIPVNQSSYVDTIHDKDSSPDLLKTSIWDMIPDDATGLIRSGPWNCPVWPSLPNCVWAQA